MQYFVFTIYSSVIILKMILSKQTPCIAFKIINWVNIYVSLYLIFFLVMQKSHYCRLSNFLILCFQHQSENLQV